MNIVTRKLLKRIKDRSLHDFIYHWDDLEALVINIYKTNYTAAEDHHAYRHLREWLSRHYPRWKAALQPYWQEVHSAGQILQVDPFLEILAVEDASEFAESWVAMQTLPAAREALNSLLLSIIEGSPS
jgi:hypothetical protein